MKGPSWDVGISRWRMAKSLKWPPNPVHHHHPHHHHHHHQQHHHHLRSPSPSVRPGECALASVRMGGETAAVRCYYCKSNFFFTKMASSQGGVGAAAALQSSQHSGGPNWSPGINQFQQHQPQQPQQQQQHHTARSLDRTLDDAVCSGILNLSGRKLREYPGMSYDLTDTTQAGGSLRRDTDPESEPQKLL